MSEPEVGNTEVVDFAALAAETPEVPTTSSLEVLRAAFRRAAELRDKPFEEFRIKSKRKGFSHSRVIRTNFRKQENGRTYFQCLIPYNEVELRGAKPKFFVTDEVESEDGKQIRPHQRRGLHLDVACHVQWVNEERLVHIR